MRVLQLLFLSALSPVLQAALRCQCSTDKGGIPCYKSWCQVSSNQTHVAACAVVVRGSAQYLACARVKERTAEGACSTENRNGIDVTKCWCTEQDYCNSDLVDRIADARRSNELREMRSSDEDEMTVEAIQEYDENSADMSEEISVSPLAPPISPRDESNVFDMRKSIEKKALPAEDESLPPWRRMNPSSGGAWKPPPPPPMPGQKPAADPTTTNTPSTTTTTTTTTTTAPPTTTTIVSYEELRRQHEEKRKVMELERQRELQRREEMEKQRMEERRRMDYQRESRRRFGDESQSWPVPNPVPANAPVSKTSTTTTTSAPTTSTTTTTTFAPTTTTTTPRQTTTTTMAPPAPPKQETKTNYEKYYRNWQPHRRPFDLNPTQKSISISNFSAIVYPPTNFVKAKSTLTVPSTTTTTTTTSTTTTAPTTTTTTTTTTEPPTTTAPIIYPPINFRMAAKTSSTSTTTTTSLDGYPLDNSEEEEEEDDDEDEDEDPMVEMPTTEDSEESDAVVMYTPSPRKNPPTLRLLPTPSVRTPAEKMDEYKKLVDASSPCFSIVSLFIISLIIFL